MNFLRCKTESMFCSVRVWVSLTRVIHPRHQKARVGLQDVREETLWGGVSTIHLTLVPKNGGYKYAEVWIDRDGMPVQSKIVEKNDDATTMRLVSIEKNAKISSDDIPVKLDSNVKVIKS